MRLYERELEIPLEVDHQSLRGYFANEITARLDVGEIPIRFVVTSTDDTHYRCEVGVMANHEDEPIPITLSIFHLEPRGVENMDRFNAVLIVPTGIGAEIGGHAGDAGPVAKLLASACDLLITHPNVVNGSDINELPENGLYVEGSVLDRLLMGTISLQRVRSNRVHLIIDAHPDNSFSNATINAMNAARACYGLDGRCVLQLDPPIQMRAEFTASGRAAGRIEGLDRLVRALMPYAGQFDALALASVIEVPWGFQHDYFTSRGECINPWGGVEAMLTHAISLLYNVPTAHAPMFASKESMAQEWGVVDPRMAAEVVSQTFLQSVLKGLLRSPRIVADDDARQARHLLTASDISCLVIPDGCLGLPILAALEQGIRVIAVQGNRTLSRNKTSALPWKSGQYLVVENYLEAVGVMCAMRAGVSLESVRRPLTSVRVDIHTMENKMDDIRSKGAVG